ncbi:MAG: YceI family protein [Gammaproteobacteria bacterium]|nr:YceI family protein [Gammaproteobacteria bacterium]
MKVITNTFAVFLIALVIFACSEATSSTVKDVVADESTQAASEVVKVAMAEVAGETEEYKIDIKGAHASILFKVNHLGYSWLQGRFNDFDGAFTYDTGNPDNTKITVTIDTSSVDSNHAERDKHLRSDDFLDVEKFPTASFESTAVSLTDGSGTVTGNLTLHGVTKAVVLNVSEVGTGEDPWGGYRRGFTGTTEFKMADFGITKNLGPASQTVYMELNIEGIRQ